MKSIELNKNKMKKVIIELFEEDSEFRSKIIEILFPAGIATRQDLLRLLDEIKELRVDFNREMVALREDMRKEFGRVWESIKALREDMRKEFGRVWESIKALQQETKALREDMRKEFNRVWESIKALQQETKALREDMQRGFREVHRHITILGSRHGQQIEEAFRKAMMDLVKKAVGANVTIWKTYDAEGIVYGEPSDIEVDLAIVNKEHILVEIKSRVRKSDVAELLRISEVYKRKEGVDPKLAIVAGIIDKNAKEYAKKKGITVYTYTPPEY